MCNYDNIIYTNSRWNSRRNVFNNIKSNNFRLDKETKRFILVRLLFIDDLWINQPNTHCFSGFFYCTNLPSSINFFVLLFQFSGALASFGCICIAIRCFMFQIHFHIDVQRVISIGRKYLFIDRGKNTLGSLFSFLLDLSAI